MGQNSGIGGLANAMNAGLTSYRDTRRDIEDREYLTEERGLKRQRDDTAYAQQQTTFARNENDRAREDNERTMAKQIKDADIIFTATGGGDPSGIEASFNSFGEQYGFDRQIAIKPLPDGTYNLKSYDKQGRVLSDEVKGRDHIDKMSQIMSLGPQKIREMQAAKAEKQSEREDDLVKGEVDYSRNVNRDAIRTQAEALAAQKKADHDLKLKNLEGAQGLAKQRVANQGKGLTYNPDTGEMEGGGGKQLSEKDVDNMAFARAAKGMGFDSNNIMNLTPATQTQLAKLSATIVAEYRRDPVSGINAAYDRAANKKETYPWQVGTPSGLADQSSTAVTPPEPTGQGLTPRTTPQSDASPKGVIDRPAAAKPEAKSKPVDYSNMIWTIDTPEGKKTFTYDDVLETAKQTNQTPEQVMKAAGMR